MDQGGQKTKRDGSRRVVPITAGKVSSREPAASDASPDGAEFVGREPELSVLRLGVDAAIAGKTSSFLISGEAGIGKTQLANEAARRAAELGARVAWGISWEDGGAPPFWPWEQAFASLEVDFPTADPQTRRERTRGASASSEAPDESKESDASARFRLFSLVARRIAEESSSAPLVLIFDDLQFADEGSLQLLNFVLRTLRSARAAFFLLQRAPYPSASPGILNALGLIAREARPVPLLGLSAGESSLLLKHAAHGDVPLPIAAKIFSAARGNPLFLRLVGDNLNRAPKSLDPMLAGIPVPENLRVVLDSWLARFSAPARSLAGLAAVAGPIFELLVLRRAVTRMEGSDLGAFLLEGRDVNELLGEMLLWGVLEEDEASRTLRFSHALVRDAIYQSLPLDQRLRAHHALGRAYEELDPNLEVYLENAAYHFHKASLGTADASIAIRLLRRCGEQAMAKLAFELAADHFSNAVSLALRTGDPREHVELLTLLGQAQLRGTAGAAGEETLREAIRRALAMNDSDSLGRAALSLAGAGTGLPRGSDWNRSTGDLLLEVLDRLDPEDSPVRALLTCRAAAILFEHRPLEFRETLAVAAVDMARRLGDPRTIGIALLDRHSALWDPLNAPDRLQWASEAHEIAQAIGDTSLALRAHTDRILAMFELGDPAALDIEIPQLGRYAEALGEPRYVWLARHLLALTHSVRGNFTEAERLAQEAYELGSEAGDPQAQVYLSLFLEIMRFYQGRLAEFEPLIRSNIYEGDPATVRLGIGLIASELDRFSEAEGILRGFTVNGFAALKSDPRAFGIMAGASTQLAAYVGDADAARSLYSMLLPYDGRFITAQHLGTVLEAPVAFYLGCLATTFRDWSKAEAHFESSLAAVSRLSARPNEARTLWAYGRMLVLKNTPEDAARATKRLARALDLARELGMELLRQRIEALLAPLASESASDQESARLPAAPKSSNIFRREGGLWLVRFGGASHRFGNGRGFEYLSWLLAHPRRSFHCLEMVSLGAKKSVPVAGSDAGPHLDARAREDYRRRLAELEAELAEAEGFNDRGRTERALQEIAFLQGEIARAFGLNDRPRRMGSVDERARINVRRAIAAALKRMSQSAPELVAHLNGCLKTGTFCVYEPEESRPQSWETEPHGADP